MCGIAGIFGYDTQAEPVSLAQLRTCRDYMSARGPDAKGEWVDDAQRIALAHRRLSIIDLEDRANQPMSTPDNKLVIVFNGEIYSYRALRAELQQKGHVFRSSSDTEVLLHLYREHGARMVEHLRGMYAFAIWDAERRSLFLARDPYGIKPLYWSDNGKTFRFASQVRALMAAGGIPREQSAGGWVGFHLFGSVPEPLTPFRAVRSLSAGSTLLVSPQGMAEVQRSYSIGRIFDAAEAAASSSNRALGKIEEEVRGALLDSVRAHMVADVPVGAFLSGGIDSGALVGLMRDAGQSDIQTMTLSFAEFRGQAADEAPIAAEVARTYGTQHTLRIVSEVEFRSDLSRIFEAMDQPTVDGINTWFISKAARELGLKVVLSGLGGDELFGGYSTFRNLPRMVKWMQPFSNAHTLARGMRQFAMNLDATRFGLSAKAAGIAELGPTYPGAYLLYRGLRMPWELDSVMPREMAAEGLAELAVLNPIANAMPSPAASNFAKVASLEASIYMRNQLLRDADWTSMAHSLEARVPLVDHVLLERLAGLSLGRAEYAGKRLLRLAPGTPLPQSVLQRPKTGFQTPIQRWIQGLAPTFGAKRQEQLGRQHWSRSWAQHVETMWRKSASA